MIPHVIKGNGAPATAPEFIGQHYVDETNGEQYLSNGTAVAGDWQKVGSAGAEAAATADSGAAYTADLAVAPLHVVTLTGNCAISLGGAPAAGTVGRVHLALRQSLGNAYTVSWPASVLLWPADTAPGAPAGGQLDRYTFETWDGGALWIAAAMQRGFVFEEAFSVGQVSYSGVWFSVASQSSNPGGVAFSADGARMFIVTGFNADSRIYQYDLGTAWDVSTAVYNSVSFYVGDQDGVPTGIIFSADGSTLFMIGAGSDGIYQYNLGTAWDVSTAVYNSVSFNAGAVDAVPVGIAISADGKTLFMGGNTGDSIYQLDLSAAWDLSTAVYNSVSLNVSAQDAGSYALAISGDGTRLFVAGDSNNAIYQYDLSAAWDLSTASYSGVSLDIGAQDSSPDGVAFDATGTRLFLLGGTNNAVFQYD